MKIRLLLFMLVFSIQLVAEAQTTLPLIINIDGQVYRWLPGESEPTWTGCDLQGNVLRQWSNSLALSSSGEWAAFMVLPKDGEDGAPSPTGNLWLCNVGTGEAYALSNRSPQQPGNASAGVFSPDGGRIIWTELVDYASSSVTMFVHDLASRETSILVESLGLDDHCGAGSYAPRVIWGEYGIALAYSIVDDISCDGYEDYGFSLYAEDGTLINSFLVSRQSLGNYRWLDSDEPRIAYVRRAETMPEPQVYNINMLNGDVNEESGTLEAFISMNESAAVTLSMFDYGSTSEMITLLGTDARLETATDVAFSPDGTLMAIILGRALYFAENGNLVQAPWNMNYFPITTENSALELPPFNIGQFQVAWAEPVYRLVPEPSTDCPSVNPLNFNEVGYVAEGLGDNNVREAPFANAEIIGSLPEGTAVSVIPEVRFDRPRVEICSDGIRWREIFFEGRLAWTAESQGDTYYLED